MNMAHRQLGFAKRETIKEETDTHERHERADNVSPIAMAAGHDAPQPTRARADNKQKYGQDNPRQQDEEQFNPQVVVRHKILDAGHPDAIACHDECGEPAQHALPPPQTQPPNQEVAVDIDLGQQNRQQ